MFFALINIFLTLSTFTAKTSTSTLDERLSEACSRDLKIVAASKSLDYGIFYLYEKEYAWEFDFELQKIVDYIPDDFVKERLGGEKIIRATGDYKCEQGNEPQFEKGRFVSDVTVYDFKNIRDNRGSNSEPADRRLKNIVEKYKMETEDLKAEEFVAVGTVWVNEGSECKQRTFFHIRGHIIRICYTGRNCDLRDGKMGVYHPQHLSLIKSLPGQPDALAYEHNKTLSGARAVFVSRDVLYSWTDGQDVIKEISIHKLFKCSSHLTVIMIVVGIVVLLVIMGAVSLLAFVLIRKRKDFEDGGTVTVANVQTVVKRNK